MLEDRGSIFHYTDAVGLVGLFQSGVLWANHVLFMNDAAETQSAIRRVYNIADRFMLNPDVEIGLMLRKNIDRDDIFVSSFTTLEDDLGMWRGYGPDQGFAIEFGLPELEEAIATSPKPIRPSISKVLYSEEEFDRLVEEICSKIELGQADLRDLVHAMTLLKDPSWRSEREVRLSLMLHTHEGGADAEAVSFRPGRFGATPYVKIPMKRTEVLPYGRQPPHAPSEESTAEWPTGLIRGITIGPGFHQETRERGINTLALKLNLEFPVTQSRIAYR